MACTPLQKYCSLLYVGRFPHTPFRKIHFPNPFFYEAGTCKTIKPKVKLHFHGNHITANHWVLSIYPKKFSQNSNGKVSFSSFQPKYSGPCLEVVRFDHFNQSGQHLPFHFHEMVSCLPSVNYVLRDAWHWGTEYQMEGPVSAYLALFYWKMFHYTTVDLDWSDWSDY